MATNSLQEFLVALNASISVKGSTENNDAEGIVGDIAHICLGDVSDEELSKNKIQSFTSEVQSSEVQKKLIYIPYPVSTLQYIF